MLLKDRHKAREDEEENVSSHCTALR